MTSNVGPVGGSSPSGSIYDLGYRHYEGARRGRLWAVWSLYVESLRGIWGFGRPFSGKAAPFILAGIYVLPAAFQLAFSSVIAQEISQGQASLGDLLNYGSYFADFGVVIVLFLVAQAPEVVCRDQRYQVLPLYFTRALSRFDYALARLASLVTAVLVVLMAPVVVLFVGDILMSTDTVKAFTDEVPKMLPAIPSSLLIALMMSSIALALSSFSPRRAYAAIGVLAYFLLMEGVPAAIYAVGHESGSKIVDYLVLLMPSTGLAGANYWFFGKELRSEVYPASLGPEAYVLAALVIFAIFAGVLFARYRKVAA